MSSQNEQLKSAIQAGNNDAAKHAIKNGADLSMNDHWPMTYALHDSNFELARFIARMPNSPYTFTTFKYPDGTESLATFNINRG